MFCKPVEELVFRFKVQLRPRCLADVLTEIGPRDENLGDHLGEPVASLLVDPPALQAILPELIDVGGQIPDCVEVFEQRDEPHRGKIDVGMVTQHVLAPRAEFPVEFDDCFRPCRHAHLQGENHAGVAVPRPDLVDLVDVEHRGVDGKRILSGNHVLMYPGRDQEPLEKIAVHDCLARQSGIADVAPDIRNQCVQFLPQFLVDPEIIFERLAPLAAQVHHPPLEAVVVVPERGDGIAREMKSHPDAPKAAGLSMEGEDAAIAPLKLMRE